MIYYILVMPRTNPCRSVNLLTSCRAMYTHLVLPGSLLFLYPSSRSTWADVSGLRRTPSFRAGVFRWGYRKRPKNTFFGGGSKKRLLKEPKFAELKPDVGKSFPHWTVWSIFRVFSPPRPIFSHFEGPFLRKIR